MLSDALYYPTRGDDALVTILIGGVLSLLSFLLVPVLFVFGYYLRVLERTVEGDDSPPTFENWGGLAVNGLLAFLVTVAYYVLPVAAFVLLGGLGAITGSESAAAASVVVATLVGLVLFVALTYVYPAAITNFARTGRAGKAFAFDDIRSVVLSGDYLVAWLLGFVIFAAGFVVIGVLSIVPIVGAFVGLFVNFYVQMAAYRVFGTAFRRAASGSVSA